MGSYHARSLEGHLFDLSSDGLLHGALHVDEVAVGAGKVAGNGLAISKRKKGGSEFLLNSL